jgi:hypothetical protein
MRWAALVVVVLVAGCGGGEKKHAETTSTQARTVKTTKSAPQAKPPKYVPSARHKHRPPGFVYNDEVGENVVSAPYDRIIELFGPPASRHGRCIKYNVVGQPHRHWEFCFKGQRMTGAAET